MAFLIMIPCNQVAANSLEDISNHLRVDRYNISWPKPVTPNYYIYPQAPVYIVPGSGYGSPGVSKPQKRKKNPIVGRVLVTFSSIDRP
ncbi:hypothetical protein ACQZV8_03295 [Magnetococcales bacterium HHB-1]